ncbi:MAG: hypothetical protein V4613_12760 [Bacteroidota bacterium]
MKLRNCLSIITHRLFILIVLCCIGLAACKKESPTKSFSKYEGQWKPSLLSQWNGLKAANFPSGIYYNLWKDKIIYVEMELKFDTAIGATISKEKLRDTCNFQYNITTTVDNDAKLTLTENYTLLDSTGQTFKTLNYKMTIGLVEGQSEYGYTNHKQTILPDSIAIWEYAWQGTDAWNKNRSLVRK